MAHHCAGCSTTAGIAGCPEHGSNTYTPPLIGVNDFITTCRHGVDLRFVPRCYLCKPAESDESIWHVHGYTCDLCEWGRDKAHNVEEYAVHLRREHCGVRVTGDAGLREAAASEEPKPAARRTKPFDGVNAEIAKMLREQDEIREQERLERLAAAQGRAS